MPCSVHTIPFEVDKVEFNKGQGPSVLIEADGDTLKVRTALPVEVPLFTIEAKVPYSEFGGNVQEAIQLSFEGSIGRVQHLIEVLRQTFTDVFEEPPGEMALFVMAKHPLVRTWGNTKADRIAAYDPFTQKTTARVIMGGDTVRGWVITLKLGLVASRGTGAGEPGVFELERATRLNPRTFPDQHPEQLIPLIKWDVIRVLHGDLDEPTDEE